MKAPLLPVAECKNIYFFPPRSLSLKLNYPWHFLLEHSGHMHREKCVPGVPREMHKLLSKQNAIWKPLLVQWAKKQSTSQKATNSKFNSSSAPAWKRKQCQFLPGLSCESLFHPTQANKLAKINMLNDFPFSLCLFASSLPRQSQVCNCKFKHKKRIQFVRVNYDSSTGEFCSSSCLCERMSCVSVCVSSRGVD